MKDLSPPSSTSWLALVAETAGVSGATITRVQLSSELKLPCRLRVVVQVLDPLGRVIGATFWFGRARELNEGIRLDLGCDEGATWGSRIVAWIDDGPISPNPRLAQAPFNAEERLFDRSSNMKLMLSTPPGFEDEPEDFRAA